jgi:hypothetical protein
MKHLKTYNKFTQVNEENLEKAHMNIPDEIEVNKDNIPGDAADDEFSDDNSVQEDK